MNILHLANHCDEVGNGIMNVAVDLACGQADLGHRVAFASGGGSFVRLLEAHGVEHSHVEQPWRQPFRLFAAYRKIRQIIHHFQPDIISAHMVTGALLGHALRTSGGFCLVTTVHNEWQRTAKLMGVGDRVIAVSDNVRDRMESRGVPSQKLRVVRNGPLGSPRRALREGADETVILQRPAVVTVAGMYERKGIRELIEAFVMTSAEYPDAWLYLVGEGPDRPKFQTLAESQFCKDRIVFTGFQKDPRPYLEQADVFVLASRSDPSPLVIPEAREAGCAIIATAAGGIPEALNGGEAGILVPPLRIDLLADALRLLLADPGERAAWRARARMNLQELNIARTVAETIRVYEDCLAPDRVSKPR